MTNEEKKMTKADQVAFYFYLRAFYACLGKQVKKVIVTQSRMTQKDEEDFLKEVKTYLYRILNIVKRETVEDKKSEQT
jgi:hypothetical protein